MSYREEYQKYIRRELSDSYIKDGRTISYKPHYHSFDTWFDSIWIDTKEEILQFIKEEYNDNKITISKIKWNKEAREDLEMYRKYFDENIDNLSDSGSIVRFLSSWVTSSSFYGNRSNNSKESIYEQNRDRIDKLLSQTKEEFKKYLSNKYIDWKQFDEFLHQPEVIWSEDYQNDLQKLQFMQELIKKYGKSEKIIMGKNEFSSYGSKGFLKYLSNSYVNMIIIKNSGNYLEFSFTYINEYFNNWDRKVNYTDKKLIKEVVLTKRY